MQEQISSPNEVGMDNAVVIILNDEDPMDLKSFAKIFDENAWGRLMYTTKAGSKFNAKYGDVLLFENGLEIKRSTLKNRNEIIEAVGIPKPQWLS